MEKPTTPLYMPFIKTVYMHISSLLFKIIFFTTPQNWGKKWGSDRGKQNALHCLHGRFICQIFITIFCISF